MDNPKNILIIWNNIHSDEVIKKFLRELLRIEDNEQFQLDVIKSPEEFQKKKNSKFSGFTHIIISCELTWVDKQYADFYGIELAQREIRMKCNNPILFVSFCSRKQILTLDSTKEIISAYGLGNHFIQLPVATEDEIKDFWKMPNLTELEMLDVRHFCAFDSMISAIKHEIRSFGLDETKKRILAVLNLAAQTSEKIVQNGISKLKEKTKSANEVTIDQVCDEISGELALLENPKIINVNDLNVLLLEDEDNTHLESLKKKAEVYHVHITHCKTVQDAITVIENDRNNSYSVLITDFRLYDENAGDKILQKLLYPQGYMFFKQILQYKRLYKYMTFTKLPRAFRLAVSQKLSLKVESIDKELMLLNDKGQEVLIQKIIELAEENIEEFNNLGSQKEDFTEMYKYYKSIKSVEGNSESEIADEAKNHIQQFDNITSIYTELFSTRNTFCKYILNQSFNAEFKLEKKIKNFENIDSNVIFLEEFYKKNAEQFITKLSIRRLAIYMYCWFSSNQIKTKDNYQLGISNCVNAMLQFGYISLDGYAKIDKYGNKKDSDVSKKMSTVLYLTSKQKGKDIYQLSDIMMTIEERAFFECDFPEIYKKWSAGE